MLDREFILKFLTKRFLIIIVILNLKSSRSQGSPLKGSLYKAQQSNSSINHSSQVTTICLYGKKEP